MSVGSADLLNVPATPGAITDAGVRANVAIGLRYPRGMARRGPRRRRDLRADGDAATAEISRSQLWQWIRNGSTTADGTPITDALVRQLLDEEEAALVEAAPDKETVDRITAARQLFEEVALADDFVEFLTCRDGADRLSTPAFRLRSPRVSSPIDRPARPSPRRPARGIGWPPMAEPFLSEIRLFSFVFPPKGWALCNGQLLPITKPGLFHTPRHHLRRRRR